MFKFATRSPAAKPSHEIAWFRITVIVASAGLCTGKFLIWLNV